MLGDVIQKEHLMFIFIGFVGIMLMVNPFNDEGQKSAENIS